MVCEEVHTHNISLSCFSRIQLNHGASLHGNYKSPNASTLSKWTRHANTFACYVMTTNFTQLSYTPILFYLSM